MILRGSHCGHGPRPRLGCVRDLAVIEPLLCSQGGTGGVLRGTTHLGTNRWHGSTYRGSANMQCKRDRRATAMEIAMVCRMMHHVTVVCCAPCTQAMGDTCYGRPRSLRKRSSGFAAIAHCSFARAACPLGGVERCGRATDLSEPLQ